MTESKLAIALTCIIVISAIILIVVFVLAAPQYFSTFHVPNETEPQPYTLPIVGVLIIGIVAIFGIIVVVIAYLHRED